MNLSKSKYCMGVQCNKKLWLEENHPEEKTEISNDSILDNGTEVGKIAKDIFGPHIDIKFNNNLNEMIEDTKKSLLNEKIIITEASFLYKNNFCSIDILKKENNCYEIYEVKSSTKIKDIFIDDISYQYYVLNNLGYKITKACIIYVNNKYIKKGALDLKKLFNIEDVTNVVISKQKEVEEKIIEINTYMKNKEEQYEKIGIKCTKPYECPFFDYCTKHLPENNVFKIRDMKKEKKFDLYNKGIYTFEDLLKEDINPKYKEQIELELYNIKDKINKPEIRSFINKLYYPLYFLDFETYQDPIPKYDETNPYMQIPFQYSLHYIEKSGSKLEHTEFLGDPLVDPRRALAEKLVKDIPLNSCILAYNMKFEKMVIKNLSELYPDLKSHLLNIYNNMYDLMIPFYRRDYYTKDMKGSYSIKYVLPALYKDDEKLNYKNLEQIHNGTEAMSAYANLASYPKEEQEKIRKNLLEYCKLDTYAMVKIWEKLKEI